MVITIEYRKKSELAFYATLTTHFKRIKNKLQKLKKKL